MTKIILFSGLTFLGLDADCAISPVNSQPLCFSEKQCIKNEKGEEACNSYAVGFYQSSYPWLSQFIWQKAEESSKYVQVRGDFYGYNTGAAHGNGGSSYDIFDKNSSQIKRNRFLKGKKRK